MSILGETFEPWVQSQVKIRQNLHGLETRDNTQLGVLNNQNAWLKLGSSVTVEDNGIGRQRLKDLGLENAAEFVGIQLASKSVLFNTMSDLDVGSSKYTQRAGVTNNTNLWNSSNAYGLGGNQFGIVPAPGLISADIKAKNRGSIREANIVIKANNKFQFELIELLYLRLGFSMLLEWGWNKYYSASTDTPIGDYKTTGTTLMETYWFQQTKTAFTDVIDKIQSERMAYEGNYDGFLGKVVNFDWKFNPDGTYDITLKLITVGDVIESLKVNLPQTTATVGQVSEQIQKNATPVSSGLFSAGSTIITNAGDSTLSYNLYSDIVGDQDKFDGTKGGAKTGFLSLLGVVGDEINNTVTSDNNLGTQPASPITPASNQGGNTMKYSFFLTFRELLAKVEKYCLPTINGEKILGVNLSEDQICAIYPYQFSQDPRICFVQPFFLPRFSFNTEEQFNLGTTADGSINGTGINNYSSWLQRVNRFGNKDGNAIFGHIMDIYLNYDFVTSILANETNDKGDIFLFKFLQKICDGINDAMGGINNIECVLTKDRYITFIEQNPIAGIGSSGRFKENYKKNPVPFELFGYNPSGSIDPKTKEILQTSNFVRDFGFNTKIDPQLVSMITIGATAEGRKTKNYDGTAFSKWNDGLQDRFSYDFDNPEEPPLLEITSGSAEISPLTLDQVVKIKDHYENKAEIDERNWIGFRREQVFTSFGGNKIQGIKDIPECPITGKSYQNYTWEEYGSRVRNWQAYQILKGVKNTSTNIKDDAVNYITYCVRAFGGKENNSPITTPNYFKFDDGFIKLGKNAFKGWVNTISNKNFEENSQPSNTIGFIPIDLSLKCDGLSGVKIYNELAIRQEFLPKQYPKALKFIISQVNHSISDNDWTTELKTISTANVAESTLTAEDYKLIEYDLTDKELIYAASTFGQPGALTIIPGVGGIPGSGIAAGVDPGPIINPKGIGSSSYKNSPLAKWFTSKGVTNGINSQIIPLLVDTGIPGNDRTRKFNNGGQTWLLAAAPAAAWVRWKADCLASGYKITLTNGYRSQEYQKDISGPAAASPGKSPHGWGGAADIGIYEETSKKLRHQINQRYDFEKKKITYGSPLDGRTGEGALLDRLTEDWKVVALCGARYGFYNPARLQNKTGKNNLDEAWHFEYWGPVEVGYTNQDAVAGAGSITGASGTDKEKLSFNTILAMQEDLKKIFAITDNFGPNNKPLIKPAVGGNDDEALAIELYQGWLNTSKVKTRLKNIQGADKSGYANFLQEIIRRMQGGGDTAYYTTQVGGTAKIIFDTDFPIAASKQSP